MNAPRGLLVRHGNEDWWLDHLRAPGSRNGDSEMMGDGRSVGTTVHARGRMFPSWDWRAGRRVLGAGCWVLAGRAGRCSEHRSEKRNQARRRCAQLGKMISASAAGWPWQLQKAGRRSGNASNAA